ncbi:MAG: hypothetical protein IH624_18755 [Phycisphaerae bacterium]|nr:hypothetical protein [Phycisphaerae bacterium]
MGSPRHRVGGVTFWAWLLSVLLHAVLLVGFFFARFTNRPDDGAARSRQTASRAQIKRLSEASPAAPKPKIKKLFAAAETQAVTKRPLDIPVRSRMEPVAPEPVEAGGGADAAIGPDLWSRGVEFFGQFTDVRKICYVVDCSGSMHGRIGLVKTQLRTSVASLRPDQFFCVVFFLQGNLLLESGGGALVRATPAAKAAAYSFIDRAIPSGTTDPLNALTRAMSLRDASGAGAGLIYFLTDGFDLQPAGAETFAQQVCRLRGDLAPATVINTIGFWTEPADERILQEIAAETGGEFVNIAW